ncbi:phosphotransferase family protein [Sphingopyxis sp. Q841]|uniref:phosphotransferase family protein n=1 Tax=Sphingopyxis sp. Q841 TaxID=3458250 RepID=UPI004035FEA8
MALMLEPSPPLDGLEAGLDRTLRRCGLGRIVPESLVRLTAGASQETWAFDAKGNHQQIPLILRRLPAGASPLDAAIGPELEAIVIRAADAAGVAVPSVRHVLEPIDELGRGFICDRVEGETLPRKILRDARFDAIRPRMAAECGTILAHIHGVRLDSLRELPEVGPREKLTRLASLYRRLGMRRPVFEAAFRWLEDRLPDPGPVTLVHGDFRNGNLIVGPEGVRAVLDWEVAHLGDPAEDLGWIMVNSWRFGNRDKKVGGFGDLSELRSAYEQAGGRAISERHIAFWRTLGSLNWGIGCLEMALPPSTEQAATIERCMIGRRSSETEIDILDEILSDETSR